MLDYLGVVVLRKSLPSPEKSAAVVQEALSTAYPGAQAELQNYANGGGVVYGALGEVMQQFCARQHNPDLRRVRVKAIQRGMDDENTFIPLGSLLDT